MVCDVQNELSLFDSFEGEQLTHLVPLLNLEPILTSRIFYFPGLEARALGGDIYKEESSTDKDLKNLVAVAIRVHSIT